MKKKLFTIFQITALTAVIAITAFAAGAGTAEDPVVTKSYVDKCINDTLTQLSKPTLSDSEMSEIAQKTAALLASEKGIEPTEPTLKNETAYKAVELKTGKIIIGSEGSEIILRSGMAYAYITGVDTILDATSGTSLIDKNLVQKDHIIIIPRSDGRGIRATEDSWVLVRGSYSIQDYIP